jgi:hypothetical protein
MVNAKKEVRLVFGKHKPRFLAEGLAVGKAELIGKRQFILRAGQSVSANKLSAFI